MGRFDKAREILANELEAVRQQHADLDTHEVTAFTIPLLTRAVLLVIIGVIPLMVVRAGDDVDEVLVSVVASFALAAVAAAVITWLFAIILSTFVTMVIYRKPPKQSSRLATRTIDDSFGRFEDVTSAFMLLALVVGLIALAVGLPTRSNADASTSVVEDLLMAQVAILLAILAIAFLAEAARASADVVDDQSPALAWPWALFIIAAAWILATVAGPLEFTTMVRRLLVEWLPATIDGTPRAQIIDEVMPRGARWWATFGALIPITAIWWFQAVRHHGFDALKTSLPVKVGKNPADRSS